VYAGNQAISKKREISIKPADIWTDEDHALFLKYCPSKRDRCYDAIANDTSARPHELLNLKIKDITFKVSSTTDLQYECTIKNKTKPGLFLLFLSIYRLDSPLANSNQMLSFSYL
jgi:hypothetical protein